MPQQPRIVSIRRVAVPAPSPQPTGAPLCARCGHRGPLALPTTGVGHWPRRNGAGVVRELACSVPGCSCVVTPVAAEWWRP